MRAVNCGAYAFKTLVVELHRMFRSGRHGTSSEAQPGRSHVVARLETFAKMEEALRVQTSGHYELETQFDVSVGTVHTAVRRLGNDNVRTQ
jgi:hypothetical protein